MTASRANVSPQDIAVLRGRYPQAFGHPPALRLWYGLLWAGGLAVVVGALWQAEFFDVARLVVGVGKIGQVLRFMFPPAHHGWLGTLLSAILETLAMAFLGTLLASVAALPFGFLGAKNILPLWGWHFGLRRFLDGLRGVDMLIWALMFVNVVGLGPFAGILAIAMSDTGVLAKLYAEAIENVDRQPVEGVRAAGGNWLQVIRFGVFPQVLPVMLSHVLYYFESNTRSATILGVVGAGGIGVQLADRMRVNNWDEACFLIIMVLLTVALIDAVSRWIRLQVITPRHGPQRFLS